ncbi:AlkZ family DNA glycosylase [Myxococcaceae bacterium JPH2]|nr:AlkZ family DNA glycosylase [Myxococcaceae bacterium JPH2]
MSVSPTLTRRQINRATLARQMLLSREKVSTLDAVERLAGLQAQLARPPFLGLWSRVRDFQREDLSKLLLSRKVVRGTLMRGTLHLASARDYRAQRAVFQELFTQSAKSILRERAENLDVPALVAEARAFFDEQPRPFEALRDFLVARHPKFDERAMGFTVRMSLPVLQVPTEDDAWAFPGTTDFAVAETWLGAPLSTDVSPRELVLRYLAAFGPASVTDAQEWSGLSRLKDTFESLRPQLVTFRDERGRELFDLPKAPRPSEDVEAPVRFLPDFDNLILGHDDRTRVVADAHRKLISKANLRILPTFLVDGFAAGTWSCELKRSVAALELEPFGALTKPVRTALTEEGEALLRFMEPEARDFEVRVAGEAAKPARAAARTRARPPRR